MVVVEYPLRGEAGFEQELFDWFPTFAELCLKIRDKKGDLVPFVLNSVQWRVWELIWEKTTRGEPVRLMILKGRQQGMSTFIQGIQMWLACTRDGFFGSTIAQRANPYGSMLFGKLETMFQHLPLEVKPTLAPGKNSGRKLVFGEPSATMIVESAEEGQNVGRSFTASFLHCTEVAFWRDAGEIMKGSSNTMPYTAGTYAFIETTANGIDPWFKGEWDKNSSVKAAGGNPIWEPVFVSWSETPEYQRERNSFDAPLDEDELGRMERFGFSEQQILWYRDKISESGRDTVRQEFPDEPSEAFVFSGSHYFPMKIIDELVEECRKHPTIARGSLVQREYEDDSSSVVFEADRRGGLWLWEEPVEDGIYLVSCDPSTGRSVDRTGIVVLRWLGDRMRVVASFTGLLKPTTAAMYCVFLARYYNEALWVPERNHVGEMLVEEGLNVFGYQNVYRSFTAGNSVDGFVTTPKNRSLVLENLAYFLVEGLLDVWDHRIIDELSKFVFKDGRDGRAEAQRGARDDLVMSLGIGLFARDQLNVLNDEERFEVWD